MLKRFMHYLVSEYVPVRSQYSTRQGSPLSGSAIDNHWKALRSFFRWAHESGLIDSNPSIHLPRPAFSLPEIQPYTEDEVKRLLKAAEFARARRNGKVVAIKRPTARRNIALILLLLDTGLRLGEVARLRVGDVRLDVQEIYISQYGTGKKTKSRVVPMGRKTSLALWRYFSEKEDLNTSDYLFGLVPRSIRALLIRLGKIAGVPHTRPHRFRHTFAIEYLRNGGDVFTLQRILGHSSLDMVRRYLNIAQADLQAAHRKASPADNWKL